MGVEFLSAAWADAVTAALNSSDEFVAAAREHSARVQQIVTGGPEVAKYYFTVERGTARIGLGEVEDAEATITQNYETAVAIQKQELNAQNAFMQGKLKISGNMMKLMQLQGVFNAMPKAASGVEVEY